ncbi:MBOAT family O-acyltransferase [Azospirillum canadense]|uniref:MBOAT family O-acyltransferase n=1 Tax=Azospirillum canadense TaxID=403962 RepID=UPI002226AD5B|nr:MBOAT family protein [Azospirillum canadense]MCW2237646.1 D-alanyl-lipoteichoic acid acyltransferase DltB (MBOAT superfamily) [Azospirillum canadense]
MLFHTQSFVLGFLPAVLILFYAVARREAAREWVMVIASVVFYGWWDVRFVPLLLGQTLATWALAHLHRRWPMKWIVPAGVAANLAILGYFKYANFFLDSLSALLGPLLGWDLPHSDVLLPIGISFFTFELISYLIDLRRGRVPTYPLRGFCLFVFFFPHLIAGPIVRHNELIPQLADDPLRPGFAERFGKGLALFILGFAKKVLLADPLARVADPVFAHAAGAVPGLGEAWSGALAFSFQLYFDFSAYTEMALGIALLFGIRLPMNFDAPYKAASVRDFWRRWHMTLSRYLRDYLYIPLGGSRAGFSRYVLASLATMGLCGLWHGAAWTFVAWGLMHGVGLIACHVWQGLKRPLPFPLAWALTMLFVVAGWVLFRAPDFATAGRLLAGMVGEGGFAGGLERPALLAAATIVSTLGPTSLAFVDDLLKPRRVVAVAFAAVAVLCLLEVGKGQPVNFIYFQF